MSRYSSLDSCAPSVKKEPELNSCFSYQSLARIARRFNKANPQEAIPISKSRKTLWKDIRSRMPNCNNEKCWTEAVWLKGGDRNMVLDDFKPPIPQGKYVWLNSEDIDRVVIQYEKVFPSFLFLGTYAIDFQQIQESVVKELMKALRNSKIKSIGIVLNLDYHDEPGSHWVSVFIDKRNKTMEYFDSFGENAPDEVAELFERLPSNYQYKENHVVHQRKNSECGNYAINFIVQRLRGSSFEQVTKNIIRDEEMNSRRKLFFDPLHEYNNQV